MTDDKEKKTNSPESSGSGVKRHIVAGAAIAEMDNNSKDQQNSWQAFKLEFEIYLTAADLVTESEQRKVAVLLHNIGSDGRKIFKSFGVTMDKITLADLMKRFESHFTAKNNVTMERHRFFSSRQQERTIEQYITTLKNYSFSCDFGKLREDLIKSVFICGLDHKHNDIKERLLTDDSINLEKAIDLALIMESSKRNVAKMDEESVLTGRVKAESEYASNNVNAVKRHWSSERKRADQPREKQPYEPQQTRSKYSVAHKKLGCGKCGMIHQFRCPAEGKKCNYCGGMNHFSRRCFSRIRKDLNVAQELDTDDDEEDEDLFVGRVEINVARKGKLRWNLTASIKGHAVVSQLDTGADTNVMSLKEFLKIGYTKNDLDGTRSRIFGLGGNEVEVFGTKAMDVAIDGKEYPLKFHIIKDDTQSIIGLPAIIQMDLLERKITSSKDINNIYNIELSDIFKRYEDLFKGLGCLKEECRLILKEDAKPTIDSPRRVPFNLIDPLKKELDRMVGLGVIKTVEEPTDWVNSIVLVKKPNGNLRICLDPRNLNKAIKRSHYQFPTVNNIKANLAGAKFFSTVDANSGFWTVNLDEQSSKLCTFITPFGRYRFLRLPFGICSAPEYFHSILMKLFKGIKNIIIYIDDILIYGKTKEEHDKALEMVFERARQR